MWAKMCAGKRANTNVSIFSLLILNASAPVGGVAAVGENRKKINRKKQ